MRLIAAQQAPPRGGRLHDDRGDRGDLVGLDAGRGDAGGDQRRPQPGPARPRRPARPRGGAGRDRRLLVPPQQRQQLLGALHRSVPEAERGQPEGLDGEPALRCPGRRGASTRSSCCRRPGKSKCDTANPVESMLEQSGSQHRLLPDPLDRLRGQGEGLAGRDLQTRQPARLHLLHPARDLGPGHLRNAGHDRRRLRRSAPNSAAKDARASRCPNNGGNAAPGSSSSPAIRSTGRCTPTTTWRSAARRNSAAPPPT